MKILDGISNSFVPPEEDGSCNLFTYERLSLVPLEQKIIILPYLRDQIGGEYLLFQPSLDLIKRGILILWDNLNTKESAECFKFLLFSYNQENKNDYWAEKYGRLQRIDILPNTLFGQIFCLTMK